MSSIHLARQGFITKAALPNVTRQRGTTTTQSNLMLYGAGKTTVSNNTTFVDSSTNAFAVTRNGDTVQSGFNPFSGVSNGAGFFDGTGDSLSVADNAALELGSNQFCIEGWCYPTSSTGFGVIITKRTNSTTSSDWIIYRNSGSYGLVFSASANGSTWNIIDNVSFGTMTPNAWNHFAVYRVTNAWYGALNGTVTTLNASNSSAVTNSATPVTIGSDTNANAFAGYLSNVRIVNGSPVYTSANFTPPTSALTAITNTSLLLLMENYSIVNSTSANLPITVNGNATISTAQFPTGMSSSIYFDGVDDRVATASSSEFAFGTAPFTVECYFHRTVNTATNPAIFATSTNNLNVFFGSTGIIGVYTISNYFFTTTSTALNTWYHFAISRDSTRTTRMFLDGVLISTFTENTNYSNMGFLLGNNDTLANDFTGYMSNFRVVKGAAIYTSNFTTPSAPLPLTVTVPNLVTNSTYGVYQLA
jgi:hypothetical protein